MRLSEFKGILSNSDRMYFELPNGEIVPEHFHVTEIGKNDRTLLDCGGTIRQETVISFQLWTANDFDHRLESKKLLSIISLLENQLSIGDHEIEVEYQGDTIGKYGLEYSNGKFVMTSKVTDCLAKDKCGITEKQPISRLVSVQEPGACTPGSGCC